MLYNVSFSVILVVIFSQGLFFLFFDLFSFDNLSGKCLMWCPFVKACQDQHWNFVWIFMIFWLCLGYSFLDAVPSYTFSLSLCGLKHTILYHRWQMWVCDKARLYFEYYTSVITWVYKQNNFLCIMCHNSLWKNIIFMSCNTESITLVNRKLIIMSAESCFYIFQIASFINHV